ncbi:hypothetical protein TU94_29580 [Streptomyces cyaneogriseus subsp. noncyanogenus]|uniref:Uncharacterized protein n=1 Tax=Streptomyces cyaneogriseus subsp. noncyanogenus TaxID=477245 RepID=A0A0C5GKK7_9ACTN|nr:hypothetical protein TU94_29580 [Streptomyces cyaneogriseus subsp. noncyanogenus]
MAGRIAAVELSQREHRRLGQSAVPGGQDRGDQSGTARARRGVAGNTLAGTVIGSTATVPSTDLLMFFLVGQGGW